MTPPAAQYDYVGVAGAVGVSGATASASVFAADPGTWRCWDC